MKGRELEGTLANSFLGADSKLHAANDSEVSGGGWSETGSFALGSAVERTPRAYAAVEYLDTVAAGTDCFAAKLTTHGGSWLEMDDVLVLLGERAGSVALARLSHSLNERCIMPLYAQQEPALLSAIILRGEILTLTSEASLYPNASVFHHPLWSRPFNAWQDELAYKAPYRRMHLALNRDVSRFSVASASAGEWATALSELRGLEAADGFDMPSAAALKGFEALAEIVSQEWPVPRIDLDDGIIAARWPSADEGSLLSFTFVESGDAFVTIAGPKRNGFGPVRVKISTEEFSAILYRAEVISFFSK